VRVETGILSNFGLDKLYHDVEIMTIGGSNLNGYAGIGTPGEDGWNWKPAPEIAGQLLVALEVIQGKHPPAFVPLPVEIK
jgi:hypothetical protein